MEIELSVAQSLFLVVCSMLGVIGLYLIRKEF